METRTSGATKIEDLKRELTGVRQACLSATRQGDFFKVAKLTQRAAAINRAIIEAEGMFLVES